MSTGRKTVLITGCSHGGIGHELAKEYHSKGLRVIATARRLEALSELITLGLEALVLDVTNDESIRSVRDTVASMTDGSLHILVNNADPDSCDRHRYRREFAPLLIASGDGCIVNIGSIAAIMPYPFSSSYNASKAALHAYGNTLRVELAPFNVQVITIVTGGVKSNLSRNRRLIQPSSIYAPIADIFAARRLGRSQLDALATDVYARQVVAQTTKPHLKAWFWTGAHSLTCWTIDTFLGRRGFDWLFSRMFGLQMLKKFILDQKKKT
ncbi:NAD(P)-binding protein [Mycena sp. CBHHK59/15]|nr:NAD(P)-binding protein [Mycena sp. CBHHK59/15]